MIVVFSREYGGKKRKSKSNTEISMLINPDLLLRPHRCNISIRYERCDGL